VVRRWRGLLRWDAGDAVDDLVHDDAAESRLVQQTVGDSDPREACRDCVPSLPTDFLTIRQRGCEDLAERTVTRVPCVVTPSWWGDQKAAAVQAQGVNEDPARDVLAGWLSQRRAFQIPGCRSGHERHR